MRVNKREGRLLNSLFGNTIFHLLHTRLYHLLAICLIGAVFPSSTRTYLYLQPNFLSSYFKKKLILILIVHFSSSSSKKIEEKQGKERGNLLWCFINYFLIADHLLFVGRSVLDCRCIRAAKQQVRHIFDASMCSVRSCCCCWCICSYGTVYIFCFPSGQNFVQSMFLWYVLKRKVGLLADFLVSVPALFIGVTRTKTERVKKLLNYFRSGKLNLNVYSIYFKILGLGGFSQEWLDVLSTEFNFVVVVVAKNVYIPAYSCCFLIRAVPSVEIVNVCSRLIVVLLVCACFTPRRVTLATRDRV